MTIPTMTAERLQNISLVTVEAIAAASTLHRAREVARETTAAAARQIEAALGRALAASGLSAFVGAPNLGTGSLTLRAINVRAKYHDDKLRRVAANASPPASLILDARGVLMMASLVRDGDLALSLRPVLDEELVPDDLELIAEAAVELLSGHRAEAGGRVEGLERTAILAQNLTAAIRAWDAGAALPIAP